MTERPKDNRAARRRDSARQMRALLQRFADRSPRPLGDVIEPCRYCAHVLDHADDCLWLETRAFLAKRSVPSSTPTVTSR